MQFRFVPEAESELAEARIWYGLQRDGLVSGSSNPRRQCAVHVLSSRRNECENYGDS